MVIKIGLADLPPFLFGGARMTIACLALIPFAWRSWRNARDDPSAPNHAPLTPIAIRSREALRPGRVVVSAEPFMAQTRA